MKKLTESDKIKEMFNHHAIFDADRAEYNARFSPSYSFDPADWHRTEKWTNKDGDIERIFDVHFSQVIVTQHKDGAYDIHKFSTDGSTAPVTPEQSAATDEICEKLKADPNAEIAPERIREAGGLLAYRHTYAWLSSEPDNIRIMLRLNMPRQIPGYACVPDAFYPGFADIDLQGLVKTETPGEYKPADPKMSLLETSWYLKNQGVSFNYELQRAIKPPLEALERENDSYKNETPFKRWRRDFIHKF